MPEELWTEVRDIVQEAVIKTIPKKKKCKKGKEEAREFQKNIYFCLIDYTKAFDCVDHNKLWKILKEMGGRFKREGIYVYLWLIHVEV